MNVFFNRIKTPKNFSTSFGLAAAIIAMAPAILLLARARPSIAAKASLLILPPATAPPVTVASVAATNLSIKLYSAPPGLTDLDIESCAS